MQLEVKQFWATDRKNEICLVTYTALSNVSRIFWRTLYHSYYYAEKVTTIVFLCELIFCQLQYLEQNLM